MYNTLESFLRIPVMYISQKKLKFLQSLGFSLHFLEKDNSSLFKEKTRLDLKVVKIPWFVIFL